MKILGTNWGFNGTYDAFCSAIKRDGYDGIEVGFPGGKEKQAELFAAVQKHGLDVAFLCGAGEKDFSKHYITSTFVFVANKLF